MNESYTNHKNNTAYNIFIIVVIVKLTIITNFIIVNIQYVLNYLIVNDKMIKIYIVRHGLT